MKKIATAFILPLFFSTCSFGQFSVLECHNKGWINSIHDFYLVSYKLNCQFKGSGACGNPSAVFLPQVYVAVIDPNTGSPWCSPSMSYPTGEYICQQNDYGQLNVNGSCGRNLLTNYFIWNQQDSASMSSLSYFLDSIVPDSALVLAYSWLVSPLNVYGYPCSGAFAPWQQDVFSSFLNLGFTSINTIDQNLPWIFLGKKGKPSYAQTLIGTHPEDTLDFQALIFDESYITPASSVLCSGATTTLSGPTGLLSYLWSTGETTQTILISEPGYYTLTTILNDSIHYSPDSLYNCVYTDSIYIGAVSCTGIEDVSSKANITFTVSPNPAKDNINIALKRSFSKPVELNVYTIYGALKESFLIPANKNSFEIPLSGYATGVYLISLNTEENVSVSQKIIVFSP